MADEIRPTWGKADYDLSEHWPKLADGTPEKPVQVANVEDLNGQPEMLIEKLRSYDIPVMSRFSGAGSYSKILFGVAGTGVDLYVPESLYHDAMALLKPADLVDTFFEDSSETESYKEETE